MVTKRGERRTARARRRRLGRSRRRRRRSGRRGALHDLNEGLANFNNFVLRNELLGQCAVNGGWHFHRDFVRFNHNEHVIDFHAVANAFTKTMNTKTI
jgi:hypothetical protein